MNTIGNIFVMHMKKYGINKRNIYGENFNGVNRNI